MQLSKDFKVHCSSIGAILSEPRSKKEGLGKTCLKVVHDWIKSQPEFYGSVKGFKSKYTDKGNYCEAESIEFASSYFGWGMVQKNEETKENDYLIGTADIVLSASVEDIKNSWSQDTFPLFGTDIPIDGYGWQGQGYLELWDKPQFGLVYTLMDAPEFLVEREARKKMYDLGMTDLEAELYDEVKSSMTYSHLRNELRIKRYFVDRDREAMPRVQNRVQQIRDYIKTL